jgi:hypothetical protein
MVVGFRMNDGKPQDETQILCDRTTFLQEMFADEERGQLRDEAHYVAKYPTFEEFVREEYAVMRADLADEGVPLRHAQYGRYRIVRELARGGMGTVYEAIDPELKRRPWTRWRGSAYDVRLRCLAAWIIQVC